MPDPEKPTSEVQVSAQDARQGTAPGIVRYVLMASLALAVIGLAVSFLVS